MRIYLPEGERVAPAVICSELPYNEGSSVTYCAEQIAAEVVRYHKVPAPWCGSSTILPRPPTVERRPSSWSSSLATR
jgi:hypothetical protein